MKRLILFLTTSVFCLATARAGDVTIKVSVSNGLDEQPATAFSPTTEKIYANFKAKGTKEGDKIRGVLVAEYVGDAAPANTTVVEKTLTVDKGADGQTYSGDFNFSKPTNDWPVGKYRVDVYVNDELATTAKFAIRPFKKKQQEEEDEKSEEEESGD
jgi:hypothetical protein